MKSPVEDLVNELHDLSILNFSVNKNLIQTFWLDKEMQTRQVRNTGNNNYWYMPLCSKETVVLYGIGKIGKNIFQLIKSALKNKLVAICDNNYSSKMYYNIPVFSQDECLQKFPNATYLITPQSGFLSIALSLRDNGVERENIFVYNNKKNRLEGDFRQPLKTSPVFAKLLGVKSVIIYGIGQVGKKIYSELKKYYDIEIKAICDNAYLQRNYEGVEVLNHSECIKKYQDTSYLITSQRDYLNIAYKLMDDGVNIHNIMFFDNSKNKIESV